jgi:hypothetical protein
VLTASARWQEIGAVSGMLLFGLLAWATVRSTSMVSAGIVMVLLGLYIVARFTERGFTPTRTQRWRQSALILRQAVTVARLDPVILVMFVATFLVNGGADVVGRLFPRQLVDLGFPQRPDPIVWFTGLGVLTHIVGALALRIVEARIAEAGVARRVYAAACGIGACGVILLAAAPDSMTGSAGVLLVAGIGRPVTRAVGAIVINARATDEVRATVQSFLGQVEYAGGICCGLALAIIAEATSITLALVGACALVACAGVVVRAGADRR